MVFPILGANTESAAYEIDNSLRFNDDDSAYLSRTPSSASNRKTWTWSSWIKRSNISLNMILFSADDSTGHGIYLDTSDKLYLTKSGVGNYGIDAQLRDVSAWYHIVVAVDTTQTGMSNIVKFYINGVQRTASGTTLYSTNDDTNINNNSVHNIGRFSKNSSFYYDGYLSEVNFVDGSQLTPSSFGETNDNGVWVPKKYTGSYGTNGFFLEFKQTGTSANSSGIGADTSGNDHHFTPSNLAATDITVDTPTNNFCTGNPLALYLSSDPSVTLSEGNVKGVAPSVATSYNFLGTFGSANMNFYFEVKATDVNQNNDTRIGVVPVDSTAGIPINGEHNQVVYRGNGEVVSTGETALTSQGNITDGMIVGVAVDPDNNVKWYLNGTLTSTQSINATYRGPVYIPYFRHINSATVEFNFGNPSFSISSGNADANGYGNFEYAVPSGYYALCTKNLAEFG